MGYIDTVQAYFLELTGRGAILSGRDVELLMGWRAAGATIAIICRGIELAVQGKAERPRDIWACRWHIEPLIENSTLLAVGRHEEPLDPEGPQQSTLSRIQKAGEAADRDAFRDAYRDAWKRVKQLENTDSFEDLVAVDNHLLDTFWDALTRVERAQLEELIAAELTTLKSISKDARQQHIDARRRHFLKREFGLVSVLD